MTPTGTHHEPLPSSQVTAVSLERLIWVGPLAMAAATLANVLFYYFVTRVLEIPILAKEQFPPPVLTPLPVTDIVLFSLIFSIGAVFVFWLVAQFSRRAVRDYLIISAIVLIVSLFMPLKIPTPPVPMSSKWSLVMMHIIGGVIVVGILLTLCPLKQEQDSTGSA